MKHRKSVQIAAVLTAAAGAVHLGQAETLYALNTAGQLLTFDSATPGTLMNSVGVTGLGADSLIGLDLRPNGDVLYGVSTGNGIFTINPTTGAATSVGTLSEPLNGAAFGFDFNPVPDRLRVVSTAEQNLRINVGTGATLVDGSLAYAVGDANFGANPNIVGAAYANNFNGALTTTLYGIDSSLGILVTQVPPNAGTLNTVGALGIATTEAVGFDIARGGIAYAALTDPTSKLSGLYTIHLGTGAATWIGQIGGGSAVIGLTAIPEPTHYAMMFGGLLLGAVAVRRWRQSR